MLQFATKYAEILEAPFGQKLEIASKWLEEVSFSGDNFTRKIHDEFLSEAKTVLGPMTRDFNRTVVLVDNLDKSWMVESNLTLQAQLFLSLLGIHRRITGDLGGDASVSVVVFVRRNIFEYILNLDSVREPDKLIADSIELVWHDAEMLMRVIGERFRKAVGSQNANGEPMEEFFCPTVDGVPTKQWIYNQVLPRPRDLIHFVQKSIEWAINRGHAEIQESDLKAAAESYSGFALEQIIAEYKAERPWLPEAIWSFMGEGSRWAYAELVEHVQVQLRKGDWGSLPQPHDLVAELVGIGFLGVKFGDADLEFVTTVQKSRSLTSRVRNHPYHKELTFAIHPIFHRHLSIQDRWGGAEARVTRSEESLSEEGHSQPGVTDELEPSKASSTGAVLSFLSRVFRFPVSGTKR